MIDNTNKYKKTPIKSIRDKCLDCTNFQYSEIKFCPIINCPLYPYRMGKRPDKSTLESLKRFYNNK